jgi:hypothetical protein
MGWFIVFCLVGFLIYRPIRALQRADRLTLIRIAATLIGLVLVVVIVDVGFAIEPGGHRSLQIVAELNRLCGLLAGAAETRAILGAVLGFGIAYVIQPIAAGTVAPLAGPLKSAYLAMGTAIIVLAAISPHLDMWLAHLSSLKSSVIEIQLANVSTRHQRIIPDARKGFADNNILVILTEYTRYIDEQMELSLLKTEDLKWKKKQSLSSEWDDKTKEEEDLRINLTDIKTAFQKLIAPLSDCLQTGWGRGYNLESARQFARPVADTVEEILWLEGERSESKNKGDLENKLKLARETFKTNLMKLAAPIREFVRSPPDKCLGDFLSSPEFQNIKWELPDQTPYKDLPHLYVALAALLLFTNNEDAAVKILTQASNEKSLYKEYFFPFLYARELYFRGEPTTKYINLYEQMMDTAESNIALIQSATTRCKVKNDGQSATSKTDSGICNYGSLEQFAEYQRHAERAIIVAKCGIIYGVAQDLAGDETSAENLVSIAQEYARQVKDAVMGDRTIGPDQVIREEAERDGYRDTLAFFSIVSEARKINPDSDAVRRAMGDIALAIEHTEGMIDSDDDPRSYARKQNRTNIAQYRAHLASAQQLLDQ